MPALTFGPAKFGAAIPSSLLENSAIIIFCRRIENKRSGFGRLSPHAETANFLLLGRTRPCQVLRLPAETKAAYANSLSPNEMDMDLHTLSHNELINFLLVYPDHQQAWGELIKRFNLFVYAVISRECKKRGRLAAAYTIDDLAQEVYVKVARHLNHYRGRYENSFLLYLKIIALNTVKNHYRKQHAAGRPQEEKRISLHDVRADYRNERPMPVMELIPSADWCEEARLADRLEQVEFCLQKILNTSRHRTRDERIFHYYFLRDISVESIASYPEIDLSQQRVFGVLNDFRQKMKECMNRLEREN